MTTEVNKCLETATFRKNLLCQRGIKQDQYLFDDEESLHTFLSLSEHNKQQYTNSYMVRDRELLNQLSFTWSVDPLIEGS